MKKIFVFLVAVAFLLVTSLSFAGTHTVKLTGIQPFTVSDEFPQNLEKGLFKFYPYGGAEDGALRHMLIIGKSVADEDYIIILLVGTLDGGKTLHVLAVASMKAKGNKAEGEKFYKDSSFFSGKGPSGILIETDRFPSPEEVEKAAPPAAPKGVKPLFHI